MPYITMALTVIGLALFETISSIDNAIINAEVLSTMKPKAQRWFLLWGMLFAIFIIRGVLPWVIVWATVPELGPIGAFTATFSSDPSVSAAIHHSAPMLLAGGGTFLVLLFLHWLFLEKKNIGLRHEKFFLQHGAWFYALASIFLAVIVWFGIDYNPLMAFSAVLGSTAFFITHGFKNYAEDAEQNLKSSSRGDMSKILYLEIIDATFSIDGVLGAFAFTFSIPLILIGNGIGAIMVRQLTVSNISRIKKYLFLKNGAMYSILVLGLIMILNSFDISLPEWISPIATVIIVLYFYLKSRQELRLQSKTI